LLDVTIGLSLHVGKMDVVGNNIYFIGNLVLFPAVKKVENRLRFDECGDSLFGTQ